MQTEDGSIIQECLNGESEAFGVLVDKYREGIYAFVYARLGNFHDAEDVTQEVFVQAYRGLRSLRRWETFAFWLYRIAYARCADWHRLTSKRVDCASIEDQDPEAIDAPSLDSYRENQLDESGVLYFLWGHIGNTHFHANILSKDDKELEKAKEIYKKCIGRALELGGTVSAEHGIGKMKKEYLLQLYGKDVINYMKQIKNILDKNNILGKGNLFD